MVVRMRHNRSQTGQHRAHLALKARVLATCECGAARVSHRACPACGRYKGRVVVDIAGKAAAKQIKRAKKEGNKSEARN
ncbi:MAG: 50S ribosomal protein L32 [Candidatus Pacebacteria bacterium]|nr:50S ribosomal protein L32 [Candidatus Paceibacterota bacterium]